EFKEFFVDFLDTYYRKEIGKILLEKKKSLVIDYSDIEKFNIDLADYILKYPQEMLKVAEEALQEIEPELKDVRVRIFNLPKSCEIRIRDLRAEHLEKLVVVDGIVKRASEIRPEVHEAVYECMDCHYRVSVLQTESTMRKPTRCPRCGSRNFELVEEKLYDARWIVIEEPYEIISGERPSSIMVYLKEDLNTPKMQNKTDPGNRIKIVGILKKIPRKLRKGKSRQMDIFIDAIYVETVETEWEDIEITLEDEKKIKELASNPSIYEKLVKSFAPSIYGHEPIKEALILQMFGGVEQLLPDRTRIRGEIHILLLGDPSTAKSQLLKLVASIVPRAKYVSGKAATAAGLTATVTRDEEFLGGWVLEAGAVVMANKSICSIDEFEKVEKKDLVALHEAMEQGSISIAKASIIATLPAKTSILAAGNPKYGRFDPFMPIKDQIDIPDTLLSRFDLKFALRDIPNPEIDKKITEHIIKTRYFREEQEEEQEERIPVNLFRKYISYARKNCKPQMTREAYEELQDFFLKMREKAQEGSPIPITWRQFEGLLRLAQASAKIRLDDFVRREDAQRAIKLMKASLRQFGFDPETGLFDIDRAEGYMSASQRGKIRTVRFIIDELEKIYGNMIPEDEIIKRAKEKGIDNVEEIIDKMKLEGQLISHKPGFVGKV
ncbi:MAG: minichromosome maintenance protein MCM, partial [Candidatus Aenigmarchaeota archaeon]|nr:minichromosome maintenance protein MCM [Candidatus Aenigmarchaeota archaeon]